MLLRKIASLVCALSLAAALPVSAYALDSSASAPKTAVPPLAEGTHIIQGAVNENSAIANPPRQENTVQVYRTEEGKTHTIYWTQGITPPKMTSDPEKLGTDGYFEKIVDRGVKADSITYQAPYTPGMGYYDLNKALDLRPEENHLCYLGAAGNMLYWWLGQNRPYIDAYIALLEEGAVYEQEEGLAQILPGRAAVWNDILTEPPITYTDNYKNMQEIAKAPLTKKILGNYLTRDDGYFMAPVFDFFINGYPAQQDTEILPNRPEIYEKDPRGGFFYHIFGKEPISSHNMDGKYRMFDFYNDNLDDLLLNGYGVTFAYLFANNTMAHAITLWGAEYDENGRLYRLYVTDSDDGYNFSEQTGNPRAIHSMNVHEEKGSGRIYLGNSTDPNQTPGSFFQGMSTIRLGWDVWEKKLSDITPPAPPAVTEQPQDAVYAIGAEAKPLTAAGTVSDTGEIRYQWYEAPDSVSAGTPVAGADKSSFSPDTSAEGTKYYYCRVINHKNGKDAFTDTRHAAVTAEDIPLVNAEMPKVTFNTGMVKVSQYGEPVAFRVNASSPDGGMLTYQWYRSSDSMARNGTLLKGETDSVFYPPLNEAGRAFYYCVVTNHKAGVSGKDTAVWHPQYSKRLEIAGADITEVRKPVIRKHPADAGYEKGGAADALTVSAKAVDGAKLSYQWYRAADAVSEGTPVPDAKSPSFLPPTDAAGTAYYYCRVTASQEKAPQLPSVYTDSARAKITVKGDAPAAKTTVTGRGVFHGSDDTAEYLLYPMEVSEEVIRAELRSGSRESAVYTASKGALTPEAGGQNSQSFTFADVEAGVYRIAAYKSGHYYTGHYLDVKGESVSAGSFTLVHIGDTNNDGVIDATDMQRIYSHLTGENPFSPLTWGDVNEDGIVDATDMQRIYSHLTGENPL